MEYEIPEGWDESDLEMILVQDGDDQELDEKVLEIDGKKYLAMWKIGNIAIKALNDYLKQKRVVLRNQSLKQAI